MPALWALLAQAFMVVLGYTAACLAGAAFATVAIMDVGFADLQAEWDRLAEIGLFALSTTASALVVAFWPAVVAVALTEGLKLRGLVAYLVAGSVVGLVTALPVLAAVQGELLPPINGDVVKLSIASGAVGGFVYWLIAGRTAGRWLELRWLEEPRV